MTNLTITNAALLDVDAGTVQSGFSVRIDDGLITAVERGALPDTGGEVIDAGGRTLMPGLIDCHVHICAHAMTARPPLLAAMAVAHSGHVLHDTIMRGFTTVRDAGGADAGYKQAVERGLLLGPRAFVSGYPLSQTGGHGDSRHPSEVCACVGTESYRVIADGVDEVRRAAREQIRRGADQIKIMASGGVASPADPIDYVQYSMDELNAIVDEARRANKYAMAHAYMPEAIRRAVEAGVRSIEHGNFLDEPTARMMAERGTYLVPTLVVYRRIVKHGKEVGASDLHIAKAREVLAQGTRSLEIAQRAGVKMAFGTDLFKAPKEYQSEEFLIRAEVLPPADVLRSATVVAAELLRMEQRIGRIRPGYIADLLLVDGNPLEDLGLLQEQGKHLALIMKDGSRIKDTITDAAIRSPAEPKALGHYARYWSAGRQC